MLSKEQLIAFEEEIAEHREGGERDGRGHHRSVKEDREPRLVPCVLLQHDELRVRRERERGDAKKRRDTAPAHCLCSFQ